MHVVLICHVYPPESAPAGIMVREIAEDLINKGNKVTVITGWPNHPQGIIFSGWKNKFRLYKYENNGINLIRCGHSIHPRNKMFWRIWYYFSFSLSTLINGLRVRSIDSVLCLSTPIFGTWSSWILAKIKKARFVYDIFDLHPESALNSMILKNNVVYKILLALDTKICQKSELILTLSESMKKSIVSRGILPERIKVAPFWVDTNKIRPESNENPWRTKLSVSPNAFICLYAGTMGLISGLEMIADTARRLINRKEIIFLCVGEGAAKEKLQKKTIEYGLNNIIYLPFQPSDELNNMFATANIGIVTLLPEAGKSSNPSKVLGYMAAGRPIMASVGTDSETAEIIRAGKCGWVVSSQDSSAMANAICKAADDREETKRAGERAREYVKMYFSREVCVDIYREALKGNTYKIRNPVKSRFIL